MAIGMAIFMLIPDKLLMIFNASDNMLKLGVPALRIICINFIPAAVGIVSSTLFQSLGKGVYSLIVSALRQLVIILPVAKFLSSFGVNATWYAFPIAEIIALCVSIGLFINIYRKKIKDLGIVRF